MSRITHSGTFSNYTRDKLDGHDYDSEVGRYCSIQELLIDYLEKEENGAYNRTRAGMEIWLGWMAAILYWGRVSDHLCLLQLFTRHSGQPQSVHNVSSTPDEAVWDFSFC